MSDTPTAMQPSTPPSRKGTVVLTVLLTLACVFIFEGLGGFDAARLHRTKKGGRGAPPPARARPAPLHKEAPPRDMERPEAGMGPPPPSTNKQTPPPTTPTTGGGNRNPTHPPSLQ